jgi:beta-mannosidase
MRTSYNLGELEWTLSGWMPYVWRQQRSIESGEAPAAEVPGIPARIPGSVQDALRDAGIIPDWNVGLNALECEWVENRHWIYTARLPDTWFQRADTYTLRALGLDYKGWILLNGSQIARFEGSLVPVTVELTFQLRPGDNTLQIVFDCPPRWLGQIGYTSRMREWKPRFNYFWDWTSRLVQAGIWDDLLLEVSDGEQLGEIDCRTTVDTTNCTGALHLAGTATGGSGVGISVVLLFQSEVVVERDYTLEQFRAGVEVTQLDIDLWWPKGEGSQPLYTVEVRLVDAEENMLDGRVRRVGFVSVRWQANEGAPAGADPWICVVNDRPIFLQGVNWTPILPNFADITDRQYRHLLEKYRDLGCTMLRVWGGAFLEKEIFYDLCDQYALLVWQEFPLSSSGLDNWPPEESETVEALAAIGESYVRRRRHHVSVAVWCGGNELQADTPADLSHPVLACLAHVVREHDPARRYLTNSPSGPSFAANEENFGRGIRWDIHGPWRAEGNLEDGWSHFWEHNDGLFHSEIGAPGASSAALFRRLKGNLPATPGTVANPLWRRTSWWIEWPEFVSTIGREPHDLDEYVQWSQERQARALEIAARSAKGRFPACGGFLIWMGHDSFPCTANTSIIDFDGNLKPAAYAVRRIFSGDE